jgi:hypothetical protein
MQNVVFKVDHGNPAYRGYRSCCCAEQLKVNDALLHIQNNACVSGHHKQRVIIFTMHISMIIVDWGDKV